ncbi:MAG TPA: anhydro-N-acetylmuramic acid kinase [Ramlibacter sp.]|jgi:anhydro-N-acetylmuramic acid kinase|uniref:anhydro-N-acetylmuramic acid kinase n=1 Tax=Ramlibacter sp. TaxID=1917967 RepID=UPI002D3AC885|nr:anhydro-N-acetylmuramic acid kinase [Ramlibacter sp.]HZY18835.1 anhydro-N-acetylmuramic acid kinase [Ramlibacter sp.]
MADLFIGLMSGTSLDGVDGVLADFTGDGLRVLAHASAPFDPRLHDELLALNRAGSDELHRAELAANALMRVYADVVAQLLAISSVRAGEVQAIGAHGQTVRHRPQEFDGTGYTVQLAQPSLLAELTGIAVVADFRTRDVAAGGQGAPLAPFFHRGMFGRAGETVGVLNIGGISNLTLLRADGSQLGFDCGPGNALMDFWCRRHTGQPYDAGGAWAAGAAADARLLQVLLDDPYFARRPPKSTGRDLFNQEWLLQRLDAAGPLEPQVVQSTLAELTARCCSDDVQRLAPRLGRLLVCGGGALNTHLMARLQALLPTTAVRSSDDAGLPPLQVEATAFAWLARKTLRREPLELQSTTGARGARVLGAVWPA